MNSGFAVLGWIIGIGAVSLAVFLPETRNDWPTANAQVAWEVLQRPLFVVGVCWIIFACATGNGGFINSALAWDGWLPWARLSYVGYLIHPILLYWYAQISPNQFYPTHWQLIMRFLAMMLLTMGASFLVSLFFEAPFSALERVM